MITICASEGLFSLPGLLMRLHPCGSSRICGAGGGERHFSVVWRKCSQLVEPLILRKKTQ